MFELLWALIRKAGHVWWWWAPRITRLIVVLLARCRRLGEELRRMVATVCVAHQPDVHYSKLVRIELNRTALCSGVPLR